MTFASFSTVLAVFENLLAFAVDTFGISRKKASLIGCIAMLVLSMPCVLGFNVWGDLQLIGARGVQDSEDFLVSNLLLPIGAVVYLLFCVSRWGWGFENYLAEANTGKRPQAPPLAAPLFPLCSPPAHHRHSGAGPSVISQKSRAVPMGRLFSYLVFRYLKAPLTSGSGQPYK